MSEVIRVSAKTEAKKAAGAIVSELQKSKKASVVAIGVAAVNQAVKAVAIANNIIVGKEIAKGITACPAIERIKPEETDAERAKENVAEDTQEVAENDKVHTYSRVIYNIALIEG